MGWRRVADILMGMQARDVVVKASYAKALKEEREEVVKEKRTELDSRYLSIQENCRRYPKAEEEKQRFLDAYPMMRNVEFQYKVGMCPTPLLRGYINLFYMYISKMKLEEAEEAAGSVSKVVEAGGAVVTVVKEHTPSMPNTSNIKRSLQVSALVVIAVVLLIFYMITGRGRKGVTVVT